MFTLGMIDASNGGGYVRLEELSEALGAYMLAKCVGIEGGKLIHQCEDVDLWHYKGREWRITVIRRFNTERLHFDYIRDIK